MSLLQLAGVIGLRRIISGWRLETVLFLGILLAVALISSGVVYSDLLAEAALQRSLDRASPEDANIAVRAFNGLEGASSISRGASAHQEGRDFVDLRVWERFQPYFQDRAFLFESSTFFFQGHPQLELNDTERPRGKITYLSSLSTDRIEVVDGRWPYSAGTQPGDGADGLEVAIDDMGSRLLDLGVGDLMEVFPPAAGENAAAMQVKIVGLFRRSEPEDGYWYRSGKIFSTEKESWSMVPLFTTEAAILERVGGLYPGLYTEVTWLFYLDRRGVHAGDVDNLQRTIEEVEYDVRANLDRSGTSIGLDAVLDDYERQLFQARVPLYLVMFLVTGMLIYYLVLVAVLVVKTRSSEISMLKSRGATTFQIGLLALVEGSLLAVPAVALGPLVALGVSEALGSAFFGFDAGGADVAPVLGADAFLLGAGGALLAVFVLTIATLATARHGVVESAHSGARPQRVPFLHRYYLDFVLLALIGVIWWQTQSRGSVLVWSLGTTELEVDWALLLDPVLKLLALGLVVMRAFPWAVTLMARLIEPAAPPWLVQGLRHVSRDPILPGALVVLLTLAMALGVIGSAFSSTLERSQQERALYEAGADLRILHDGDRTPLPLLGLSDLADQVDGVAVVAEVRRTTGSPLIGGFSTSSVDVLAVDAERFSDVAWYRPDFARGKSLADITGALTPVSPLDGAEVVRATNGGDGIGLPSDATSLAVWANQARVSPGLSLRARLQDSRGYYFDALVGALDFTGWRRLEGRLSPIRPSGRSGRQRVPVPVATPPYTLLALHTSSRRGPADPGVIFLDQLTVRSPGGEKLLAAFETTEGWHVVQDVSSPGLYALESSESVVRDGSSGSAAFSWSPGRGVGLRGIRTGPPEGPLPAVVSQSLLDDTEARVGDTLSLWMSTAPLAIQAVAVADFFPTLDPKSGPFAIVDLRTFTHYTNLHGLSPAGGSNELWVELDGTDGANGKLIDALGERGLKVKGTLVASEMVSQRVEQPLVNAGWGGLLVLIFLALVLASGSGVMLFSYVDSRERRTEFVLLRTLGFSRRQLNGVVWFNLFLVAVCGIALGTWVGHQIGVGLLPILENAEEGARVTPPMVLSTNWGALLVSYLVLGGVTVATLLWLAWMTGRLELQRVLRIGEP